MIDDFDIKVVDYEHLLALGSGSGYAKQFSHLIMVHLDFARKTAEAHNHISYSIDGFPWKFGGEFPRYWIVFHHHALVKYSSCVVFSVTNQWDILFDPRTSGLEKGCEIDPLLSAPKYPLLVDDALIFLCYNGCTEDGINAEFCSLNLTSRQLEILEKFEFNRRGEVSARLSRSYCLLF